jgi:hypothetical protein
MIAVLPAVLLLIGAIVLAIFYRLRSSIGYSWLISTGLLIFVAGFVIALRWRLPQQLIIENWLPFSRFVDAPMFGLDGISWPYVFALTVLILAVLLTAPVRLGQGANPIAWAGGMAITALGCLSVMSGNLLTLVLTWSAIDLVELVVLQANAADRRLSGQVVVAFSVRVTGTLLAQVAAIINRSQGLAPTFIDLPFANWLLLLLAAGLRLGVLPLNLPYLRVVVVRRGLGTVVRMTAAASSLGVLARLPIQTLSEPLQALLLAACLLGALYSAAMWLAAADELNGRPFWLIAMAAMAVACVLQGQPRASLAWGMALILGGGVFMLYSEHRPRLLFLPVITVISLSGLPFTPLTSGWLGLMRLPIDVVDIGFLFVLLLMIAGALRHALRPGEDWASLERWAQAVYPIGIGVLIAALWLEGIIGWPGSFSAGVWWVAPGIALAGMTGWLWVRLTGPGGRLDPVAGRWVRASGRQIGRILAGVFSLSWLYQLLWRIYRVAQRSVQMVTEILEGEGGVLWVFVLLALFFAVIRSRGMQ